LWINGYAFKLLFNVDVVKRVAVISECAGQYKIMMTAQIDDQEPGGLLSRPAHDSPGDLTVEIRRDDAASSSPSPLGCNKFSLQTSSYWADSEAMVHAAVSKSGKESALPSEAAKAYVVGSVPFRRAYRFDVVSTDSEAVGLVMRLHFDKMGVGQVYGRKVVNLVYDGTDSRMHPSLAIKFPFGFEVTSTMPADAAITPDNNGTLVSVATASNPTVGTFFTDSDMILKREIVLFLAAALLGTGVALIAEFLVIRLAIPRATE
jgi:hypothetical protein